MWITVRFLHDSEGFYDSAYVIFRKLQYNTHRYLLFFLLLMNYGDSNYLNSALASFWMWSLALFSIAMVGLATTGHTSKDTGPQHTSLPCFRLFGVLFSVPFISSYNAWWITKLWGKSMFKFMLTLILVRQTGTAAASEIHYCCAQSSKKKKKEEEKWIVFKEWKFGGICKSWNVLLAM